MDVRSGCKIRRSWRGGSETIKQERVFVFPGPTSTTSNVRSDDFPIRWMSDQNVRSQDHGEEGGWVKL